MLSSPRFPASRSYDELPKDLQELADSIAKLPGPFRTTLEPMVNRVIDSSKRRRRILNLVQEALCQLRLDMKYLVFDLEATRRERDTFRRTLEGKNGEDFLG